jgi:transcriptional regulator with XRE-family HTH domain
MRTTCFRKKTVTNEIDSVKTGAMFRQERQEQSLSLRELARRTDLSAPYLSDLERGRRNWDDELVILYWQALKGGTK